MGTAPADPSYPSFFPGTSAPHPPPMEAAKPLEVPIIDLENPDPKQLGDACRWPGLFRLVNHGVPRELSARIQADALRILELPFELKRAELSSPGGEGRQPVVYFWGTPAVSLSLRSVNWLEGLHAPLARIRSGEWCAGLRFSPSLRALMVEYGNHMERVVRTVFDSLALDLKLDPSLSDSYLSASDGLFRIYRYPCLPHFLNFRGMETHTDSSVLTVVDQDEVGGLQIRRGNAWFDVMPVAGTLTVNIGDMLQAISNDEYTSVEHRVLASGTKERMSLCFFAFPRENFMIKSSKYREFSYSEFKAQVQEDIMKTGDKVGLKRFRL